MPHALDAVRAASRAPPASTPRCGLSKNAVAPALHRPVARVNHALMVRTSCKSAGRSGGSPPRRPLKPRT
eukprot:5917956-Alexandrium_andersonii.AAC.1